LATLAPLAATPVLPFHDMSGIIGLAGALAHFDDPATRVRELFDLDIRAYPSALYFGWGYLAGRLGIPIELAFRVFLAVFGVAGPPLALLVLLRAFGRPRWLALLAFPVVYHHQIWFGFLGSAASVTGLILLVAFGRRVIDRPSAANHAALAAALLFVATAHPFPLALALGLIAPFALWPSPAAAAAPPARRALAHARAIALRLACLVPAGVYLAGWVRGFFAAGAGGASALDRARAELRLERPPLAEDAQIFLDWLGNGYEGHADRLVPGVALASLLAVLAVGARPSPSEPPPPPADGDPSRRPLRDALLIGWAVGFLLAAYLLLPNKLEWPQPWWGVRVRCVAPLFFIALAAARPSRRGLPALAAAPAVIAALAFAGFVTYDFRAHFRGKVLDGFDEALAAIPPGKIVLGLPQNPDPHYVEGHPYLVQHYVARSGGAAAPYLKGHPGAYWITMKPPPLHPPWGSPDGFVWSEHAPGYDYFLLELPVEGKPPAPFEDAPDGAVRLVVSRGRWRLYEKVGGR
jgi:hypothetical protein